MTMQQLHIRLNHKLHSSSSCLLAVALVLLVGSSQLSEAIVKQQRSDDSSSSQQVNNQQSQPSSSYNLHKSSISSPSSSSSLSSSSSSSSQGQQPSQSISVSQSAPVSVVSVTGQQQAMPSRSDSYQSMGAQQYSGSNSASAAAAAASSVPKSSSVSSSPSSSSYGIDTMSMAASNNDQSYQAAANSVNMALANSGIFGNSQNGNYATSQSAGGSGSQASGASGASNTANLNPLHYYYYPAKDSGASAAAAASSNSQPSNNNKQQQQQQQSIDIMNSAASQSNNYPSLASYPMYADQLNGGSSMGNPEAAASNQDPAYIAAANGQQPSQSDLAAMYGGQSMSGNSQQGSNYAGDLSMFSSNLSPTSAQPAPVNQQQQQQQQQPQSQGSISFPSSNNAVGNSQQQQQVNGGNNQQGDFMNSHMGGGHQGVYPFSHLGDLSTSNFGNNAGGMSQASYMSPHSQASEQSQPQHDHYTSQQQQQQAQPQFPSISASQLSPAAVPPPMSMGGSPNQPPQQQQQQQQQPGASSLFNTASLFQQQQQPQLLPQQASLGQAANTNNNNQLLAQQYLNSFLNYNQLMGQQQPDASAASPSIVQPSAVAPSTSSGKRFGISSFIMPMLALAGLSLLIPTMSNIGTAVSGRKKRSVEDKAFSSSRQQEIAFDSFNGAGQLAKELSIGEYMDKIERYYSIYKNAVENDDCMNRLICEFGDAVKDVTGKSAVVTVIEKLVPNWMVGKVHLFKEAALNEKEGKEKCKKYVCQSNKRQH